MIAACPGVEDGNKVKHSEFRELIVHMAAADLQSRKLSHEGPWPTCSLESDEEIQQSLEVWRRQFQDKLGTWSSGEDVEEDS